MLSSGDVSQIFAAQNAAFAQQGAYAQQIGFAPPPTLSAWGTPNAWGQRAPAFPGMGAPPNVVSYAPSGFAGPSYGGGNRFAGSVMAGIGGAASLAGVGLGIGSMFGKFGAAATPFLDPIGGAMAGAARFGVAGAIGGAALPLGVAALGGHLVGSFVGGGQQQQAIGSQLGSFGFVNQQSRTGFGFTRDDAQAIGSQIRQLSHIPELLTSMSELTSLIPKLKGMGVMQGVRDATEFNQRFKESVKTLRDVSRLMGSTMDEAADFFAHSRGVGFMGRQTQLQNVLNAKYTTATTGMSMGQFTAMQQAGAEMGTQLGVGRMRGARAVTSIAQSLGVGLERGQISQETLADVTGLQGADAIKAGAEMLTGLTQQIAKSTAPGRLSMFGLAKFDEQGNYLGMDEDMADKYRSGQLSRQDLMRRVRGFNRKQKVAVSAHSGRLAMDFAERAGPGGLAQFMTDIISERFGANSEGEQSLVLQRMGLNESQVDLFQQMKGVGFGTQDKGAMAQRQAMEASLRERTDPRMIMKRIGTKLHSATFGRVEQAGSEAFTAIGKAWDEFIDDAVGRHVITMSKEGTEKLAKAFATSQGRQDLKEMFALSTGFKDKMPGGGASTMGKIIGGMGLFGATMTGFGAPTALWGATALGKGNAIEGAGLAVDNFAKSLGRLGNILGATNSTGLSAEEQFNTMRKGLGFGGVEGPQADVLMQARLKEMQTFGAGAGNSHARMMVQKAVARADINGEFSAADAAKRVEMIKDQLGSGLENLETVKRLRAQGLISNDMDAGTALALTFGGEKVKGALGSSADAKSFFDIKKAAGNFKEARSALESAFGAETAQAISDKGFGSALSMALSGQDGKSLDALVEGLESSDSNVIFKTLHDYGVKGTDYKSFLDTVHKVRGTINTETSGTNASKALEIIDTFRGSTFAKDLQIFQQRALEVSDSVTDQTLKTALFDFGKAKDSDTAMSKRDAVSKALQGIREKLRNPNLSKEEREKLISSAGRFGGGLSQGLTLSREEQGLLNSEQDISKLAKRYGLSEQDILGITGNKEGSTAIRLTGEALRRIKDSSAVAQGQNLAMGNNTMTAGERDSQLITTLNNLQKSIDIQNTLIEMTTTVLKPEQRAAIQSLRSTGEVPKLDTNGNVVLSSGS
jgi:hypothetical protein